MKEQHLFFKKQLNSVLIGVAPHFKKKKKKNQVFVYNYQRPNSKNV